MKSRNRRIPMRAASPEERRAYEQMLESQNPGYGEENIKLYSMVRILTGVRMVYGLFYLLMTFLYGLEVKQGFLTLLSVFIFYLWYTVMLRSGKFIAVMMMVFRGGSIAVNGVSILQMSFWLPFPLIFTLVAACVMEFAEAVFCIYVLFNGRAAGTIRLNREMDAALSKGVSPKTLERMAEYRNPYGDGEEAERDRDKEDVEHEKEEEGEG